MPLALACGLRPGRAMSAAGDALERPHTRPFDMTGRRMKGWILVAPGGLAGDEELQAWVAEGVAFARSLPPKG